MPAPTPAAGDPISLATPSGIHRARVLAVIPMPGGPVVQCRTLRTMEAVDVPLSATYPPPVAMPFVPPYWAPDC